MEINEYQKLALRTEAPKTNPKLRAFFMSRGLEYDPDEIHQIARLLEGLMGIAGEGGEVSDILKKVLFQGHVLDREHMALELGDVAWYLALAADALGYDLETILRMNIEKLQKRYPNGFEKGRSISREEGDI